MILPNAASGVPIRSTPRTSSGCAAVSVDAVHDVRQHVERVRRTSARRGKSAFDVVEQQPERLALPARLVAQLVHQLVAGHARLDSTCRFDCRDTGKKPGWRDRARWIGRIPQRRAIEQERLQHAVVDDDDALAPHALVVVDVVPHQLDVAHLLQGRVERDAEKGRQDRLPDAARKRLPVVGVALPVAFHAVAEDFMKEDPGSAPGQNGRARERFNERALREAGQQRHHRTRFGDELTLVGQPIRRSSEVARVEWQLHAVFGLGDALNEDA